MGLSKEAALMIKAMLVDINPEITNFYKGFLKASFPSVRVSSVLNEAVETKYFDAIKAKNPGLVIMDIRFFGLSTLRVISETAEKHPRIKILVLGTYEDHDYLRAAMERGAADYLYKPLKNRELELCMERIVKMFADREERDEEEGRILQEYGLNLSLFRDRFLTNLLGGVLFDENEIAESMEYFDMTLSPPYTVFTLRIDHFRQVISDMAEKEKHLLTYRVFYAVRKFLQPRGLGYAFINSFNSISCILGGPKELSELLAVCAEIKAEVVKQTELSVTLGLGRPAATLLAVSISAKEAEAALRYRHLLGYDTIIPLDFVEPDNEISYSYPARRERLLVHTAVAGEYEYAIKQLAQILDTLRTSKRLPERILPKIIMNIVISISRYASEQHMDIEARFREFFDFSNILDITTINEAERYMQQALRSFCDYIAGIRKDKAERMTAEIADHVAIRFYEDITLEKLALARHTTPQYLDKIFKERMKVSVSGYLTNIRMAKAKEILSVEEVDDDVVAARVGYRDVRVFRSVFRRREGMTPGEFARRHPATRSEQRFVNET